MMKLKWASWGVCDMNGDARFLPSPSRAARGREVGYVATSSANMTRISKSLN